MAVSIPADARLLARGTWPPSCAWTACARPPPAAAAIRRRAPPRRPRRGDLLRRDALRSSARAIRRAIGSAEQGPRGAAALCAWAAAGALEPQGPRAAASDRQGPRGPPHATAAVRDVRHRLARSGARRRRRPRRGPRMLGTDARVFVCRRRRDGRGLRVGGRADGEHEKVENLVAIVDVKALASRGRRCSGHDLKTYQRASPPSAGA